VGVKLAIGTALASMERQRERIISSPVWVRIVLFLLISVTLIFRRDIALYWTVIHAWHPPVGAFIAILAVLGVAVPWFRGEVNKREKAFWTLVMFALLGLELRSLYMDQDQREADETSARKEQLRQFGVIASGIESAITEGHRQFSETMGGFEATMREFSSLGKLYTGGSSYPLITPILVGPPFQLLAVVYGENDLPECTIKLLPHDRQVINPKADPREMLKAIQSRQTVILPLLFHDHGNLLNLSIEPNGEDDNFHFDIGCRNGVFYESLRLIRKTSGVIDLEWKVTNEKGKVLNEFTKRSSQ
jgi:hypothetical protein